MSLARIAVKNVGRNAFRAALTVLGVAVAMTAFVLLRTVLWSWTMGSQLAAQDRVATRHKITFIMSMPKRYTDDIRGVEGVKAVSFFNWFGGRLAGHPNEFFGNFATDPESFLEVYDEIEVPPEQKRAWFENRRGALVGAQLARKFGWKVGDRVTLEGTIFRGDWEFVIEGIYSASQKSIDQSSLYFHYDYLNESPAMPAQERDKVGWIVSKVADAGVAASVSKRIDRMFETRDIQTVSMSERALVASFIGMLSTLLKTVDIVSIVILVIMMLILGNTIAMAVRERTQEYGVLRAIGFMPRHVALLVVGEALAIGLAGGALGVAVTYPLINQALGPVIEDTFTAYFPYFRIADRDALLAVGVGMAVAAVAALLPAYQASRLNVIDALRRVG